MVSSSVPAYREAEKTMDVWPKLAQEYTKTAPKAENTIRGESRKCMWRQMLKILAGHMMWGGLGHLIHHVAR